MKISLFPKIYKEDPYKAVLLLKLELLIQIVELSPIIVIPFKVSKLLEKSNIVLLYIFILYELAI